MDRLYIIPVCSRCEDQDLPFGTMRYSHDGVRRVGICRRHLLEKLESEGEMTYLEWWELTLRRYGLALLTAAVAVYFAAHVVVALWTKAWPIQ